MSWGTLTSPAAYKSPAFIALVVVLCVALALLLHHCILTSCRRRGGGSAGERRRRRQGHHRHGAGNNARQQGDDDDDEVSIDVEASAAATSRTHLVKSKANAADSSPAAVVVLPYRKGEPWKESTCPVCLADFDDGEVVRVLPECMHYFHAECIDTWLRGSTSCPMCRAETTPTPSPASMHHQHRHHLDLAVSLEEILVRT